MEGTETNRAMFGLVLLAPAKDFDASNESIDPLVI